MRAAGNELSSAEAYWSQYISELHVPLMSVITYKGHSVIAMSLLPIDKTTLRLQGIILVFNSS